MSIRSLKADLDAVEEWLFEHIDDSIGTHGLNPDDETVLDVVETIFGATVRDHFEDWGRQ